MPQSGVPWSGWASREKKTPRAGEQDQPDIQQEREVFQQQIAQVDPRRLYYFDEFGLNLRMTRRYGLAPSSKRAYGVVPFRRGVTMTLVLGLGMAGVIEPCTFEGAMNGDIFGTYMAEQVLPHLPPDAIVVVDNDGAHHSEDACDALEARGVIVVDSPAEACLEAGAPGIQMWFLPPYSPELTPAEECGSKIKILTRAAEPRTKDALIDAMGQAIGRVTPTDARGWFNHALRGRAPRLWPEVANHGNEVGGVGPDEQPRAGPNG